MKPKNHKDPRDVEKLDNVITTECAGKCKSIQCHTIHQSVARSPNGVIVSMRSSAVCEVCGTEKAIQ